MDQVIQFLKQTANADVTLLTATLHAAGARWCELGLRCRVDLKGTTGPPTLRELCIEAACAPNVGDAFACGQLFWEAQTFYAKRSQHPLYL